MSTDTRYLTIKDLILKGYISSLTEIFGKELISRSRVARDLGLNPARFTRNLKNPERFVLKDLYAFAKLLEIDRLTILALVDKDYKTPQKTKPKPRKGAK
jgi:hypothetical protein